MDRQLEGKVAIVTGGTQGLGEAIARLFVARGAEGIVIVGRDRERGRKVADSLEGSGARALFVQADLADLEAVRRIVPAREGAFDRVDCLVNAAALTERGTVLSTDPGLFDRLVAGNVRAPFFLMQDSIRLMLDKGVQGAIVNILSTSSHGGQYFLTVYSATKTMLGTLTKNIAFSVMPHRIRVNGFNIGWTNTPGEHAIQKRAHDALPDWLEKASASRPFGRLLDPAEVARAMAFLCSAESGMTTGSLVDFDQTVLGCWDEPPVPKTKLS